MTALAPVLLFVYHRLDHTIQTVEALKKNYLVADSQLIVYSDAPSKTEHEAGVKEVRNFLTTISGFKNVKIISQSENKGLARSIVEGVTEQVEIYGKVIVLEDDLITSPYFLQYMNAALVLYQDDLQVMQVSGYTWPLKKRSVNTCFLQFASSWGWATWSRAWKHLSMDTDVHIEKITKRNAITHFNFDNGMGFFEHLLLNKAGTMNTWAVKWYASMFLQDGLCLFPDKTLVKNIGHDGSGENSKRNKLFIDQEVCNKQISVRRIAVKEDKATRNLVSSFFKLMNGTPSSGQVLRNKIRDKIKYEYRKIIGKK